MLYNYSQQSIITIIHNKNCLIANTKTELFFLISTNFIKASRFLVYGQSQNPELITHQA